MHCNAAWQSFLQHADEASLKELFVSMYGPLYAYSVKITHDPVKAEDAVQEVFFNLWKYRKRLNAGASPLPYLLRAVRNEALRMIKKFGHHESLDEAASQIVFLPQEFQDETLDSAERQVVVDSMNRLAPRQREILYLRFYEDLCFEDIANVLNINYQSAVNQAFRAISKLRKMEVFNRTSFFVY